MPTKKFLLLLSVFLFLFCNLASSAIFTVTSNADAGPGTLREALTFAAANGSAVKDYITFNIADQSEAGRTIAVSSRLPDISSNVVIDGSTQPGVKFGVSDARVKITFKTNLNNLTLFYFDGVNTVDIYGIWLICDNNAGGHAMTFKNYKSLTMGGLGKGNLFETAVLDIRAGENFIFQNNICGTDITGEIATGFSIGIFSCNNIEIGGSSATKNIIAGSTTISLDNPISNILDISYNIMGTNYTGTKAPYGFDLDQQRVYVEGSIGSNGVPLNVPVYATIKNNIIADIYSGALLLMQNLGGKIAIQGNAFNTDYTGTLNFNEFSHGEAFQAISLDVDAEVLIGGENPSERNLIAYVGNGIGYGTFGKFKITRNSIFCSFENSTSNIDKNILPYVEIKSISDTQINGIATPLSTIELFNADCSCGTPNPREYFTTIKADASGNWSYIGPSNSYVMASATLNSLTGLFTGLNIDDSNISITNATCTAKGSIKGIKTPFASGYRWYDQQGKLVASTPDLINMDAGIYTLKVGTGTACDLTKTYVINDVSAKVDLTNINKTDATCNTSGSITGIMVTPGAGPFYTQWFNANNQKVCDCVDLVGITAGDYTFKVGNTDGICKQSFGPFNIKNPDVAVIDISAKVTVPTKCSEATGSIKKVIVNGGTGIINYSWKNEQNVEVGTSLDLNGQPAGAYTLTVTDDSQCGPIYSSPIEILEVNGITISDTEKLISKATCQYDNGGISNIQVTGATKYTWYNASNVSVSNNLDLTGVPTGDYYLIAANDKGCSKQTATYTITREAPVSYFGVTKKLNDATCDENNGSIELIFENAPAQLPESYKWVNAATGQAVITSTPILTGLDAGKYDIYGTTNGCEQYIISYLIYRISGLSVVTNSAHVNDDHCSAGTGSIKGILASGKTPLSFIWTDDSGINKGTLPDLLNVPAGKYHLKVTDGSNCEQGFVYTVYDQSDAIPSPSVSDVQICSPGDVLLSVSNADSRYGYRLYEDNNSAAPIDEQQKGTFKRNIKSNRSYYISQYFGNCESLRQEVKVLISGLSGADIANAFTPNGDGINDYWKIIGIENYTNSTVKVFSRDGKIVFQSKGYATPFDGTINGKLLPTGVYYYVIDLKSCSLISGNLTILR